MNPALLALLGARVATPAGLTYLGTTTHAIAAGPTTLTVTPDAQGWPYLLVIATEGTNGPAFTDMHFDAVSVAPVNTPSNLYSAFSIGTGATPSQIVSTFNRADLSHNITLSYWGSSAALTIRGTDVARGSTASVSTGAITSAAGDVVVAVGKTRTTAPTGVYELTAGASIVGSVDESTFLNRIIGQGSATGSPVTVTIASVDGITNLQNGAVFAATVYQGA